MTHPTPSAMARKAYPVPGPRAGADLDRAERNGFAAGVAAERARIAAWLRSLDVTMDLHRIADSIDPPVPLERYGVPKTVLR